MGPTNKELSIIMKIRDEVSKKITTLEGRMQQFKNRVKQNWVELAAKVFLFEKALRVVGKAMQFIEVGARVTQQKEAFQNLADSVGANAQQIVTDLKKMSGQTLSTSQVMEKASQAIILGLDPTKLSKMMEISRASARAFGKDVDFMFESIALGIGRQSRMILDNLGIIVKADKAYEDYAKELRKTKEQLTDAERRQAFMNAAMKAGEDIIKKVNVQGKTQLENIQTLKANWKDLTDSLGEFLSESPKVKASIEAIAFAMSFWAEKIKIVQDKITEGTEANITARIEKMSEFIKKEMEAMGFFGDITGKREERINQAVKIRADLFTKLIELRKNDNFLADESIKKAEEAVKAEQEKIAMQEQFFNDTVKFRQLVTDLDDDERERFEAKLNGNIALLQQFREIQMSAFSDISQLAAEVMGNFHSGMSSALSDIILGTKKAKEAFAEFGKQMVKTIVDFMTQKAVAFAIEKTMGVAIAAITTSMAVGLATAWAPAAALASLATLGGNAAPAAAALASTVALSQGLALLGAKPMARGGDEVVTRPTFFLAGEAGPERATFTPLGGPFAGRGGGGGDTIINIGPVSQQPGENVDDLADSLMDKLRRNRRYFGYI